MDPMGMKHDQGYKFVRTFVHRVYVLYIYILYEVDTTQMLATFSYEN